MTIFLLIRHAAHGLLGHELVGRRRGVSLNEQGQEQAQQLAGKLAGVGLNLLLTSPMERALQTAEPLARKLKIEPKVNAAFDEIDFGDWTGGAFTELLLDPRWLHWNRARSQARAPRGESMREVQRRAVRELERLHVTNRGGCIGVVSHGDVIKAVLSHYLGMSLDRLQSIAVDPASVSIIALERRRAHLLLLNDSGDRVSHSLRGMNELVSASTSTAADREATHERSFRADGGLVSV